MLHTAVVGFGSNLGPSAATLQAAWSAMGRVSGLFPWKMSSPYQSRPIAMDSPHWFINAVGLLRTTIPPQELLLLLQAMERDFGRVRDPNASGYQDRCLDLDLLLYDDLTLHSPELILPHPRMHERRFVLEPLLEVAGSVTLSPCGLPQAEWIEQGLRNLGPQGVERCSWADFSIKPGA